LVAPHKSPTAFWISFFASVHGCSSISFSAPQSLAQRRQISFFLLLPFPIGFVGSLEATHPALALGVQVESERHNSQGAYDYAPIDRTRPPFPQTPSPRGLHSFDRVLGLLFIHFLTRNAPFRCCLLNRPTLICSQLCLLTPGAEPSEASSPVFSQGILDNQPCQTISSANPPPLRYLSSYRSFDRTPTYK
jgi:hypothetical protein